MRDMLLEGRGCDAEFLASEERTAPNVLANCRLKLEENHTIRRQSDPHAKAKPAISCQQSQCTMVRPTEYDENIELANVVAPGFPRPPEGNVRLP